MKGLAITLFIWIFVVPAATALLLIFGFIAVIVPGLYFPCFFLVLMSYSFLFTFGPFLYSPFRFECPVCNRGTHTIEEKIHDEHQETELGS
jgi:hypothetical protein